MPTTAQILSWIELECHGWQREGRKGTRPILDWVHTLLLADENDQNIAKNAATGDLPYLVTQAGQYEYDCPSDCWRTGGILIDQEYITDYNFANYGTDETEWVLEDYYLFGKYYYRILNISTIDATASTVAKVQFAGVDPETYTDRYLHLYWKKPVEISSDKIQHQMPIGTESYLIEGTMKVIDAINDHKNMEGARLYIETVLKPMLREQKYKGEQGHPSYSRKRAF